MLRVARVIRRPQAEADILDIWAYIAEDSILEADKWVDKLDSTLALWATQPMMGRSRNELAHRLRSAAFGRYVIFYVPLADGLDLIRILHTSRDLDSSFEL